MSPPCPRCLSTLLLRGIPPRRVRALFPPPLRSPTTQHSRLLRPAPTRLAHSSNSDRPISSLFPALESDPEVEPSPNEPSAASTNTPGFDPGSIVIEGEGNVLEMPNTPRLEWNAHFLVSFTCPPADLFPPLEILNHLVDTKTVSISPDAQLEIARLARDSFWVSGPSLADLEERVLQVAANNIQDISTIGALLARHSPAGHPFAFRVLSIAAKHGDMNAEFTRAELLSKGFPGTTSDPVQALATLQSLADRNHGLAQYTLGMREFATDQAKGLDLVQRASVNGFPMAFTQLGYMHQKGVGVEVNHAKAYEYYERGHEGGVVEATFSLAAMCAEGTGTASGKPDPARAFELYMDAAHRGSGLRARLCRFDGEGGLCGRLSASPRPSASCN
ncbi:hypothetical protein BDK51DRAFT_38706 [Blyttiomyces helicus]|uniref:HCP-like protein n=1 Tax=Blyttiomyces helicus TaxID=388810 RepID=A0A4P9W081_9FUNG|nr:hypothetical protein BDK51DRAFT_38706 [Blyttiomyces helicus]|eukprot:RKO84078.1 hypothetical protein BDK51DRAFT_38706 [Blyttiomyces helicus]